MDVLQRMPWLAQDAVFQKLASIADVASLSKTERMAYDENLRMYRDTLAVMDGQYQDGTAVGCAEEKKENARRMKEDGMSSELISKYTGLTADEVESLS
jgi:hypothetical protein